MKIRRRRVTDPTDKDVENAAKAVIATVFVAAAISCNNNIVVTPAMADDACDEADMMVEAFRRRGWLK
jgi:hypothetical protein